MPAPASEAADYRIKLLTWRSQQEAKLSRSTDNVEIGSWLWQTHAAISRFYAEYGRQQLEMSNVLLLIIASFTVVVRFQYISICVCRAGLTNIDTLCGRYRPYKSVRICRRTAYVSGARAFSFSSRLFCAIFGTYYAD